jgi:acyl carrier protein
LPALTINWGPWEQVGMAANAAGLSRRAGMDAIPPDQGLDFLERLLSARVTQAAVLPIHWPRFLQQYPALPTWARELTTPGQKQQAPAADVPRGEFLKTLEAAAPGVRHDLLLSFLQEKTATVLGLSAEEAIDPARPLREMGFDSLMVVEMRNTMEVALDRSFPPILFFDYPTLEAITTHLLGEMFPEQSTPAAPATVPADRAEAEAGSAELASLVDRIAGLSEEQLDSLLGEQDQQPLLDHEKP